MVTITSHIRELHQPFRKETFLYKDNNHLNDNIQFAEQGLARDLQHSAEPEHVSRAYVYLDDFSVQLHGKLLLWASGCQNIKK